MPSNYLTPAGTIAGYGNPYYNAPTLGGAGQSDLMNLLGYNGQTPSGTGGGGSVQGDSTFRLQQAPALPGSGPAQGSADDLSFLADQAAQLRALLGRTDTGLNQGLTRNEDQYNEQVGGANAGRDRQYAAFDDQRIDQNQGKLSAYDTINKNANNGYRSLAQIIGRASGTGSSAFRDLLPNVVGRDTSSKRQAATDVYGRNLQGIDKAKGQYDISFADVLADLAKQKKNNEESLRTGIEGQRQGIQGQLATNAAQTAQAKGGGYAAVKAASAPFQSAIDQSRNAVEGFFSQFRTPFAAKQAVAATPEFSAYNTDRATVNASKQGADSTNPYSGLLRKKLQSAA